MTDADRLAEQAREWARKISWYLERGMAQVQEDDRNPLHDFLLAVADRLDAATSGPTAPTCGHCGVSGEHNFDGHGCCKRCGTSARPTAPSGERVEAAEWERSLSFIEGIGLALKMDPTRATALRAADCIAAKVPDLRAIGTGEDERVLAAPCAIDFCHYSKLVEADAVIHIRRRAADPHVCYNDLVKWEEEALARHASRQAKPPCE